MARLDPEIRKRQIGQTALRIAQSEGLQRVNHGSVAKRCVTKTSVSTVRHYFSTQGDLWRECVRLDEELREEAIRLGVI